MAKIAINHQYEYALDISDSKKIKQVIIRVMRVNIVTNNNATK